jgi:hypothetical protein
MIWGFAICAWVDRWGWGGGYCEMVSFSFSCAAFPGLMEMDSEESRTTEEKSIREHNEIPKRGKFACNIHTKNKNPRSHLAYLPPSPLPSSSSTPQHTSPPL